MQADMLARVKLALRRSTDDLDAELTDLIDAAEADLLRAGVAREKLATALGRRAVITYCRAHYDPGDDNYERYMDSYTSMLDTLRRSTLPDEEATPSE